MEKRGYTYGLLLNGTEIAREYNVDRIPTFFVIGTKGRVIARHEAFNNRTAAKIAKTVERQLKKRGNRAIAQGG